MMYLFILLLSAFPLAVISPNPTTYILNRPRGNSGVTKSTKSPTTPKKLGARALAMLEEQSLNTENLEKHTRTMKDAQPANFNTEFIKDWSRRVSLAQFHCDTCDKVRWIPTSRNTECTDC